MAAFEAPGYTPRDELVYVMFSQIGHLGTFAPRSHTSLMLRNLVFRLLSIPLVATVVAGRGFRDRLVLPDY